MNLADGSTAASAEDPSQGADGGATADGDEAEAAPPSAPAAPDKSEEARKEAARIAFSFRQQKKRLDEREQFIAERERRAQAVLEREQALAELESADELALIQRYAQKKGKSVDQVMRTVLSRMANDGKPTEEELRENKLSKIDTLEAEIRELREERAREAEERAMRQRQAEEQAFVEQYKGRIVDSVDPEAHPYLSTLEPANIANAALLAAEEYYARSNLIAEPAEVLEYLEAVERKRFEHVAAKRNYIPKPAEPAPAPVAEAPKPLSARDSAAKAMGTTGSGLAPRLSEQDRIALISAEVLRGK